MHATHAQPACYKGLNWGLKPSKLWSPAVLFARSSSTILVLFETSWFRLFPYFGWRPWANLRSGKQRSKTVRSTCCYWSPKACDQNDDFWLTSGADRSRPGDIVPEPSCCLGHTRSLFNLAALSALVRKSTVPVQRQFSWYKCSLVFVVSPDMWAELW